MCQGAEDSCMLLAYPGSNRVLTHHQLNLNSRHGRASIFQEVPQVRRQGVEDPCRLRACSGSHRDFNPSLAGPKQLAWASLHLSGGFPRGVVKVQRTRVSCGPTQAVIEVLTRHWLDLNSRRRRAFIFQEVFRGMPPWCRRPVLAGGLPQAIMGVLTVIGWT